MERDTERVAELSPSSDEEALVLRQKPELMQVRDKGDVTLQQWKTRQLQRLAEELKTEWQEARLQQVRDMERLYLARLLDEATGRASGNNFSLDEHSQRGSAKHMRAKERNRAAFREERGRREEHPRQHPRSRKKATCSERRGSTKARAPNPCEKCKGKRVPSNKSSGGYQPLGPRVSRGADLAKLNPLLTGAGETECVEEVPREGRRPMKRRSSRFAQNVNHNSTDESLQDKTADLEKPLPLNSTFRQEATTQGAPSRYSDKNQWHKELESAFEELFNTNQKLKRHLNLHLGQRFNIDQDPDEQQSCSEIQGESSDIQRGESTEEAETTTEECGSPSDMEAPEMWSKTNLKQLLSEAEYPRYQPMAKQVLKPESLTPVPEAGTSSEQDDSFSESPESGRPKSATAEEESLKPYLQKQDSSIASWLAMRQKQKAELEHRRQKTLLELTEHPNMSLEIHYKAELEEERRERRRMRLALLKSYSTGIPAPVSDKNTSLDNGLLDEDKQSQMIRDLQQQILEQNKLHKQFLEKARKRLQEFQKTF